MRAESRQRRSIGVDVDFTAKTGNNVTHRFGSTRNGNDIMAGGWGCPHEANEICTRINHLPCNPGMKGCVLAGRYVFTNEDKNYRLCEKQTCGSPMASSQEDNSGYHP